MSARVVNVTLKTGFIHTIAGAGEPGFRGDGEAATNACLNEPKNLTVDAAGNIYIADSENHAIRKIDRASGRLSTVAGRAGESQHLPQPAVSGSDIRSEEDPFAESTADGNNRFTQQSDLSGTVRYVTGGSAAGRRFAGDGGPATEAWLNFPTAVAVDAEGHLYIADTMNHRIRRVDANTGLITTIAGTGTPRYAGDGGPATSAALNEPVGLALDRRGNLFVADQSNNRVRMIDAATGEICTIAGTGQAAYNGDGMPAVDACLAGPSGLVFGEDGDLYIADTFNGRIRAVNLTTHVVRTAVGDGGDYRYQGPHEAPSASVSRPFAIAFDPRGNLLITDSDSHLLRRWNRHDLRLERIAGTGKASWGGDGGSALEADLNYPFGVAVDRNGNILIADTFNHRVRMIVGTV